MLHYPGKTGASLICWSLADSLELNEAVKFLIYWGGCLTVSSLGLMFTVSKIKCQISVTAQAQPLLSIKIYGKWSQRTNSEELRKRFERLLNKPFFFYLFIFFYKFRLRMNKIFLRTEQLRLIVLPLSEYIRQQNSSLTSKTVPITNKILLICFNLKYTKLQYI